ncbi:peptide MFS transporter [Legionella sp. CNM-4043-24]|uniref:peptide MFS transporter n=1 Tax=Legionella sp. CNM-4043-24 TaxID=3421646 RepID=UPI00403B21E4
MSMNNSRGSAWSKLPDGVFALFCIQIFSTLSFSVLYSTLVLYMNDALSISTTLANSIMGVFVAFNYALHLLGGYLGGRFFSYRSLFCIGMAAQVVGCVLLATVSSAFLYYGLAAFLTGSGLNVTCVNCMLTQRFKAEDTRRENAFLYNYAGMNIGFFIGFSLSGYFQLLHNYQRLFLFSSVGNLLALFICLYNWKALADVQTTRSYISSAQKKKFFWYGLAIVACLPVALSHLLHAADFANRLVILTGISMLFVVYVLARQQDTQQAGNKLYAFGVLMLAGTAFWTLFQIGPMGLTYFIAHNVQRSWLTMTIPPQWFQNINTLCIVLGGPAMSFVLTRLRSRGIAINIPVQFAFALVLIGLAFALMPLGIARADAQGLVSPMWVVLSFVLQSTGELLISPIGYAMIGALAPRSLQGVLMGMWMLSSGVGATLSSYSSNWMTLGQSSVDPLLTNPGYASVFLKLGLMSIAVGLMLYCLAPLVKRWMSEKKTLSENDTVAVVLEH